MGIVQGAHIIDNEPFQRLDIRDLYRTIRTEDDI